MSFIIDGIFTMVKFGFLLTSATCAVAYVTKPDEASGKKYLKQYVSVDVPSSVGQRVVNAVAGVALTYHTQDMVLFRLVRATAPNNSQYLALGAFGAWFPIGTH